jgi:predicted permease
MNLKLAFRRLFKTPLVTAVAVVSLALGIGANAAIFSLFDQALLRPLPVANPGELVNLSSPGPKPGSNSCGQPGPCTMVFSYPMFRDLEKGQTVFSGLAGHVPFGVNLSYQGQNESGGGLLVTGSYFPTLGLRPALGRLFDVNDDRTIGGNFVVVLGHGYWTTRLGANPNVLNSTMLVNGQSMTVVGVAPRGFTSTTLGVDPEVFVPVTMRSLMVPGWETFENRRAYWMYLFGRLKPGMSIEQAQVTINGLYKPIINDVEAPLQKGMSDQTMARFRARELVLEPGQRGQSQVHEQARTPLVLLFSITGIVLLIACANIANLLLARGAGRATEMAVRLSLGASRRQLLTQLLTESCVLAALGGVAGLVFARMTLSFISSLLPPEASQSLQFELQPNVMAFAAVLSIATGILFGLFPALHSTRPDLVSTIKAQAGQPSGARSAARFRTALVTAQIALSMALLIAAGLFTRSLLNVSRVDLGIRIDNVVTFAVSPHLNGYDTDRAATFFNRLEQELASVPQVTSVAASMVPLLGGSNWGTSVRVQGFDSGPDTDTHSNFNNVGPGFFKTLGIPLMAGREFTDADVKTSAKVAIVNEAFVKKFNLGRDAVGKRMSSSGSSNLDVEIVGIAQNAKYSEVRDAIPPVFYMPYRQADRVGSLYFYSRTSGDVAQALRAMPAVVARLDPNLPIEELKTLPQQVQENVFMDRMVSTLSASFAVLATLLAAVGLYGVLAYTVGQRTREIGLRMALGADAARMRTMILTQVGWMTLIGGSVGLAGGWLLGYYAQSRLFEMTSFDPVVMAVAGVLLALVAFGAGFIPAYRASKIHPMQALRYE